LADKEEIAGLAAWTVRWLQQLTGHSESPHSMELSATRSR
jgi:hypothetical protein